MGRTALGLMRPYHTGFEGISTNVLATLIGNNLPRLSLQAGKAELEFVRRENKKAQGSLYYWRRRANATERLYGYR